MEPNDAIQPKKSSGALIGSIIIILILIIGGIYLFSNAVADRQLQGGADAGGEELLEPSDSDELEDIEADLEASGNLDNLDSGLE